MRRGTPLLVPDGKQAENPRDCSGVTTLHVPDGKHSAETLITESHGRRIASEELKSRAIELNLADLNEEKELFFF